MEGEGGVEGGRGGGGGGGGGRGKLTETGVVQTAVILPQ